MAARHQFLGPSLGESGRLILRCTKCDYEVSMSATVAIRRFGRGATPHRRYSPRAPLATKGQQIRCNSGADGIVRMKENAQFACPKGRFVSHIPLIYVVVRRHP